MFKKLILAGLLTLGLNNAAHAASVTYDYVGKPFETFFDSTGGTNYTGLTNITGYVTFNAPIDNSGVVKVIYGEHNDSIYTQQSNNSQNVFGGEAGYSFSDGLNSLNNTSIDGSYLYFKFINGNLESWNVLLDKEGLAGEVTGIFYNYIMSTGDVAGFDSGNGFSPLNVSLTPAFEIYAENQLSGTWTLRQISAVPEPETYVMLMVGLGLIGFARRRHLLS